MSLSLALRSSPMVLAAVHCTTPIRNADQACSHPVASPISPNQSAVSLESSGL